VHAHGVDAIEQLLGVVGVARRGRDDRAVLIDLELLDLLREDAHRLDALADRARVELAGDEHGVAHAHRSSVLEEDAHVVGRGGLDDDQPRGVGAHIDRCELRHRARF
jgi:hypothetical protein